MLRKIQEHELEQYVDLAYQLAMDLSHASFPVYTDGVKTKESFSRISRMGSDREDEEILLFERDGTVEGWIHCYYMNDDQYIGVHNLLVRAGYAEALKELLEYWKTAFPGYTWHIYFPEENREAISFMKKCGYQDKAREIVDVLLFDEYSVRPENGCVIEIGLENFEAFREIHSRFEDDMYWTCDKIAASISSWEIFGYIRDEKCLGVLYHNGKGRADLEIFGIDVPACECGAAVVEDLLIGCLNKAKANGAKSMYFFNDRSTHEIARKLGFKRITQAHYFEEECG